MPRTFAFPILSLCLYKLCYKSDFIDMGPSLEILVQERDEDVKNSGETNLESRGSDSKRHPCTVQRENLSENTEHNTNSEESTFLPKYFKKLI